MITVLIGNPRSGSRTLLAARSIAMELDPHSTPTVIDLATFGTDIVDPQTPTMLDALSAVGAATTLVVASPTYKATYTGLLKVFLDALPADALAGVTALPIMLGAAPHHALAPELTLRPVLVELGASCPVRGLYLLDSSYANSAERTRWLKRTRAVLGEAAA